MAEPAGPRRLAPRAVEREARRLLPLLDAPRAVARVSPLRGFSRAGESVVAIGQQKKCRARTDIEMLEAFAARDWIVACGPRSWRITEAGIAWYRRQSAGADPYRAQHQDHRDRLVETAEGTLRAVRANATESPLEWLRGRKDRSGGRFLSDEEFEAGERLRRDFTASGVSPAVTANWSGFHLPRTPRRGRSSPANVELADHALASRQRLGAALAAVGPELNGLLVDVCCLLVGLEETERVRQWPKRSAKIVLKVALGQLARHYGLIAGGAPAPGRARHHWGRPGYRPSIDGGAKPT